MNQMQQMLMNAQRMQRELEKAQAALAEKEFTASKSGMVTLKMKGDRSIVSLDIDDDALAPENKEMLVDALTLAFNEINDQITEENDQIEEKVTGKNRLF
ncbi:MAG: YbaB/EbfC family nucleoid-associated protein [Bacilli bacterium]|nr:YbaB/EbfC family nucleoid-associated protein [Bacilli bacterium]MDY6430250.1 YbaB/EbfC family nucleoid-associated protein [Bacilli bacterium]